MMNLEWYRTFKVIYEKGTLTKAAEALFISQPGVSLHLSSLESYVGARLFDRIAKKMVPTERGKILYNALLEPINKLEEIEKQFQRSTEIDIPTVTIGMCLETFQLSLERYLHTFDFNIVSNFSGFKELLADLEKGMVDMVVTPHKMDIKGIEYIQVGKENIVLIGSKDVDEKAFRVVLKEGNNEEVIDWLMSNKWYGTASDNEHFTRFWNTNFGKNPDFRQNYIVPNFNSIIRSLSVGSGLAIVPDFLCADAIKDGNIKIVWKGKPTISNKLYIAFRKNSIYKEQIDQLIEIFSREMDR